DLFRGVEGFGEDGRTRSGLRNLEVAGVVAVLACDERVLAGAGGREKVDRELASHGPALGLNVVRLESEALEDAAVRAAVRLEAPLYAFLIAVERVAVLHDELADAKEAAAGTRLVPILDLEVVPELRELLV